MDRRFALVLACFFGSGLAGLIYQVAWSEQLMLVLGASHAAVATVLAAFMAGLALGAAISGRYADRVRRPILVYGLLEAVVGGAALLLPLGLRLAEKLEGAWLAAPEPGAQGSAASLLFFLVVSFALLLIPTTAMGATLPLLARGEIRRRSQLGPRLGMLYGVNTLGAAAGAAAAAFLLVPRLGVPGTVLVAIGINLLIFLLAWRLEMAQGAAPGPEDLVAPAELEGFGGGTAESSGGRLRLLLPLMLVSGAVSFLYEVLWTRLLAHLLGGSIFAFGAMLAIFLGGLALGAALATLPVLLRRDPLALLAVLQLLIAALGAAGFAIADHLPALAGLLAGGLLGPFLAAALALLPIAITIGGTWPVAVRALAGSARAASRAAGAMSAWNTLGAILGALGGGLLLLPALGFAGSVRLAVGASLVLAWLALMLRREWRASRLARAAPLLLPLLALLPLRDPLVLLRLEPRGPGRVHRELEGSARGTEGEVVFSAVGRSSDVMLLDQGMAWRLTTNGLPESLIFKKGSRPARLPVARWLVHLPAALRPAAQEALVVGYGGGVLLEDLPSAWRRVDVIELEAEVLEANRRIAKVRRRDPLADPRVHLVVDDARSVLRRSRRSWDVIVSQPSHPWTAASSHLFTREFFDLAASRLPDDGIFVAWMGNAYVDRDLTLMLLKTLAESFPETALYQPPASGTLLLVGAKKKLGEAGAESPDADAGFWARLGVHGAGPFQLALKLDDAGLRALAGKSPANTDARNLLKTRSPRVRQGISIGELDKMTAAFDPLPRAARDPRAAIRRLLELGQRDRAERVLAAVPPGLEKEVGKALLLAARGEQGKAIVALRDQGAPARGELVALFRKELQEGREVELMAELEDPELAVVEGWTLPEAAAGLENRLAAVAAGHPLWSDALRLRIEQRLAAGGNSELREALELSELLLASFHQPADFLLRLAVAQKLDERWTEVATLDELVEGARAGRLSSALLSRAEPYLADLEKRQRQNPEADLPLEGLLVRWRGN